MNSVRERPRLVAVRLLGLAVLVGIGVAIGGVADDRSTEVPAQTQAKLHRAETARLLARANSGLRRDLRRANRTKQPRGSRSR
jgi:hypothetical protein